MGSATGHPLRKARQEAGLTQEQLAVHAGITAKTVANIERGGNAHPGTLLLLANALGCEVETLSGLEKAA